MAFERRPGRLALAICVALAWGCKGDDGANGTNGTDGQDALVVTATEAAGANCAAGGIRVDSGIDADADGTLDPGEVASTQYVCDGEAGSDGAQALVDLSAEAAGSNCADGGTRIDSGLDADGDGLLDPAEVAATEYACNGADGVDGATGPTGPTGATGPTGPAGAVSLLVLTAEPPGPNCPNGGTRIDSGLDADADGVLDPTEVAATDYVCSPDTWDPEVVAVDPAPGQISNGASFTVTFSEAMDPATIDGTAVVLVRQEDWEGLLVDVEVVPATVAYDGATQSATLAPVAQLPVSYPYALRVTGNARDLGGNSVVEFEAAYWVETDQAGPRVLQVSPRQGSVVSPGADVFVQFDEQLNWESGQAARITLVDGSAAPVDGYTWFDGSDGVRFEPDAPLADGETYTASIDAIVADWNGNWSRVTTAWSFSIDASPPAMTGPPVVSPASQTAGEPVVVTIPVSALARYAEVYMGDDLTGWWTSVGSGWGNEDGGGTITVPCWAPYPPAPGAYSIWVGLYDEYGWSFGGYAAYSAYSADNYTTWDSVDPDYRDSGIPLAFLEITDPGWVDLAATVEFVPGVGGAGEIHYEITNLGMGAAGPFVAGIFLNPVGVPQVYSVPDYWLDFDGLAAGATVGDTIPVTVPETATRVYAIADLTASFPEGDEGNNVAMDGHRFTAGTPYATASAVPINGGTSSYSYLDVSGGPTSIADATVMLNVTHDYVGNLYVALCPPAGDCPQLLYYRGADGDNFTNTVLDDLAPTFIWDGSAPFTGTFRPESPLAELAGMDANGTWYLYVYDNGGGGGTIDSWTLTLW